MSRLPAPVRGAFLGALLGVCAAAVEVARLAMTIRGLGFRWDVFALGALMYGGLGGLIGLVLGLVWLLLRRGRRPAVRPARSAPPRPVTRRSVLRLGAGAATASVLGALVHAGIDRGTRVAGAESATPAPTVAPRALVGAQLAQTDAPPTPPPAATAPDAAPPSATPSPAARKDGPPNVVLITLDTVRADQLRAYGHPTVRTPSIDKLAGEGARFDMHVVQQPQTNPSHAAIFTGMYPSSSGVRTHMVDKIPDRLQTLATLFDAAGYETAALYSWMSFDPQYIGLDRGFHTYQNTAPGSPGVLNNAAAQQAAADYRVAKEYLTLPKVVNQATGVQAQLEETAKGRADLTTDAAIARLRQMADKPFFLWVHYFDPHYPYMPPSDLADQYDPNYRGPIDSSMKTVDAIENGQLLPQGPDLQRLIALYQAELTFMDAHIGRLLGTIDDLSLRDNTVVALTADHGEAFGEHLEEIVGVDFFHPHALFNNEQRTPLILRYPGKVPAGLTVAAPSQEIDLFPTLLQLAGVSVPAQNQGRSLVGLLGGTEDGSDRAAFSALGDYTFTSVTIPGWKFIQNNASGRRQLYDLRGDPLEQHDVSGDKADIVEQLASRTQAWMKAVGI